MIQFQKFPVDILFCFQPGFHSIFKVVVRSQIDPLPAESDADSESAILALIYSPETAFVIFSLFALFQEFHTGPVYMMETVLDLVLILFFQTAAAFTCTVYQIGSRHLRLIAAVTPADPVHDTVGITAVGRIQCGQPPEVLPGNVHLLPVPFTPETAAALDFSRIQISGRDILFVATVTSAQPPGSIVAVFKLSDHSQPAESSAGQVFCCSS